MIFINQLMISKGSLCDSAQPWQLGFQDPATPIMEGIVDLHHDVMFFLVIIRIFVLYSLLRVAVPFRREKNNFIKIVHGKVIEIVWTITPSSILAVIAVPSLALLYSMDEVIDPALTLKAIGHQWYWSYEYSDYGSRAIALDSYMVPVDDLSEGDLRSLEVDNPICLPVGAHVRLLVTSDDVLHCWTIPSFGVKVDACPGRLNQTSIFINREGRYYGQCSEIRGINHGLMPTRVKAVPLDTYISWVSSQFDEKTNAAIFLSRPVENMQTLLLDLFATIATTCAMGVIVSTNSIHSVISPILVFRNATGLLLTLSTKVEFIAIMFLIIYVGAIAVLSLFVVMTSNVREADTNWLRWVPVGGPTILCFSAVPCVWAAPQAEQASSAYILPMLSNTQKLGYIAYTYYFYFLLMAGLILLVAMIGAIVLTMHKRKNASKKQFIFEQVARRFEDAICWAS